MGFPKDGVEEERGGRGDAVDEALAEKRNPEGEGAQSSKEPLVAEWFVGSPMSSEADLRSVGKN